MGKNGGTGAIRQCNLLRQLLDSYSIRLPKKFTALGFEPPPLDLEPCAIPLNQCIVFTIITNLNDDDFVCKKNKNKNKKKIR